MNKKELQNIISQDENERVEFKEIFNKQVIETIVAFANTEGGSLFIGVKDNKEIKGIKTNNETKARDAYKKVEQILTRLSLLNLAQRDAKANNFMITNDSVYLLDLESIYR